MHAPLGRDRKYWMAVNCAQLRIGSKRCLRVTWHVDFRNDLHMSSCRKGDNAAHLLLGIVTAVRLVARAPGNRGWYAPRAHRCELRELADLQAPTLIVSQMPVQNIELVPCHPINHG